ncbi:MAG: class I tRNA ligase family protein [Ferruginibacter sp.]
MEYRFNEIEQKWQDRWKLKKVYKVSNESARPKYYVLDMFPYPSGAGLHVGHPLGYIASDIYSRYKRLKGFNVLHPMGYDSFGLPAEQYAIETGQHPSVTTEKNITTFRRQLDKIGFSYDWDREVRTSDAGYYKWTQWIFLQIFDSWYNRITDKAERIAGLLKIFELEGNLNHLSPAGNESKFSAGEWNAFDEKRKQEILMDYRLTFSSYGEVNWCEALGTVLANDEVVNGVSERGGYPVVKKKMRQWYLRITEYADRLLEGLERIEFSDAMKEMQRNWIGRSQGAEMDFAIKAHDKLLRVYTTRPDTIFGVDFMVVAPEHELVSQITSDDQKEEIEKYLAYTRSRSERERLAEVGLYELFDYQIDSILLRNWFIDYVLEVPKHTLFEESFIRILQELKFTIRKLFRDKRIQLSSILISHHYHVFPCEEDNVEFLEDVLSFSTSLNYKIRKALIEFNFIKVNNYGSYKTAYTSDKTQRSFQGI